MEEIWEIISQVLGLEQDDLSVWHMAIRAFVVYVAALAMVRLGEKRFRGENTAFDLILGIILGSVVSRAVTGQAPFLPTLGAGFVLVGLHWLFSVLSFHSDRFGTLVKGSHRTLVKDGEILWDEMQESHITKNDLLDALRTQANIADVGQVKEARLERGGGISVIPKDSEPKVLEVAIADGVQTVRIEIG